MGQGATVGAGVGDGDGDGTEARGGGRARGEGSKGDACSVSGGSQQGKKSAAVLKLRNTSLQGELNSTSEQTAKSLQLEDGHDRVTAHLGRPAA